jgi:uncharacterized membrane protein (UPF0127 family)
MICSVLCALVFVSGFFSCERRLEKIELAINNKTFTVEVARTQDEQSRGLMYRKSMGEYEGMIFVYPEYRRGAFWMKNTQIPLSIAFIRRDGEVVDIQDMKPYSENPIEPRLSYVYALELNKGAFARAGVGVGDVIRIPGSVYEKK